MLSQAQTRSQLLQGVQQHGVAPGARKMMDWEEEAAEMACQTGIYGVYRSSNGQDCTRIGPSSKCFCGHLYSGHTFLSKKALYPRCNDCECSAFRFVPTRPEEVGDWWLVRRKGFNVHTWRAKCRCGHSHEEHDPKHMRCRCGCGHFQSNFACLACDKLWEDHETVFETVQERLAQGKSVGDAYRPLADDSNLRDMVFTEEARKASTMPNRLRPAQVSGDKAEKSVQIMHETSGGRVKGQDVANRYGRVVDPPKEWLYMGGGPTTAAQLAALQGGPQAARIQGRQQPTGGAASSSSMQVTGAGAGRPASRAGGSVGSSVPAGAGARPGSRGGVMAGPAAVAQRGAGSSGQRAVPSTAPPGALASGFRPVYD